MKNLQTTFTIFGMILADMGESPSLAWDTRERFRKGVALSLPQVCLGGEGEKLC